MTAPSIDDVGGMYPRIGDPVMQLRNGLDPWRRGHYQVVVFAERRLHQFPEVSVVAQIVRETVLSCPPSAVFAVLSDVERLPEFSDMTVAVKNGPGRPLQVGDHFDQIVKIIGIEVDTEWEVTDVVTDSCIKIEGTSKSKGRASMIETVSPHDDGCVVRLEVDYDPPLGLLGEIVDEVLFEKGHEEQAEQILVRLKELCETAPAS